MESKLEKVVENERINPVLGLGAFLKANSLEIERRNILPFEGISTSNIYCLDGCDSCNTVCDSSYNILDLSQVSCLDSCDSCNTVCDSSYILDN